MPQYVAGRENRLSACFDVIANSAGAVPIFVSLLLAGRRRARAGRLGDGQHLRRLAALPRRGTAEPGDEAAAGTADGGRLHPRLSWAITPSSARASVLPAEKPRPEVARVEEHPEHAQHSGSNHDSLDAVFVGRADGGRVAAKQGESAGARGQRAGGAERRSAEGTAKAKLTSVSSAFGSFIPTSAAVPPAPVPSSALSMISAPSQMGAAANSQHAIDGFPQHSRPIQRFSSGSLKATSPSRGVDFGGASVVDVATPKSPSHAGAAAASAVSSVIFGVQESIGLRRGRSSSSPLPTLGLRVLSLA